MILELHERDTEVLEQILSILKNHPEIEKFEIDEDCLPISMALYIEFVYEYFRQRKVM